MITDAIFDERLFQLTRPFTHLEIRLSGAYVSLKGSCHKLFSGTNRAFARDTGVGGRGTWTITKKKPLGTTHYLLHLGLSNGVLLEMG